MNWLDDMNWNELDIFFKKTNKLNWAEQMNWTYAPSICLSLLHEQTNKLDIFFKKKTNKELSHA